MKLIVRVLYLVCISLLILGCDKFKPTQKSKDSFKSVFSTVSWNNAKPDKKSLKTSCSPLLLQLAIANLPKNPPLKKDSQSLLFSLLNTIDKKYDKAIKTYDLEDKLAEDTGLFKVSAKDKLLNARISARNEKDFIKKVKTRRDGKYVDWGKREKKLDKELASMYNSKTGITFKLDQTDTKNCAVQYIYVFQVKEFTSQKITLDVECKLFFNCECGEQHSNTDIKLGYIRFSSTVEATFPNNIFDLNAMVFRNKGNPKYIINNADCCKKEDK